MTDLKNITIATYQEHLKALDEFSNSLHLIEKAAQHIIKSLSNNGSIYICGNGGSAADAQHIAAEFVGRFKAERKALPAIALSTDTSALTSISNDYGYEDVFRRQLQAFIKPGDIFWGLSTSGTSRNVVSAAELAREKQAAVISFTGKPESKLQQLSDICISFGHYPTARIQEINQLAYHMICDLVDIHFAK